MISPENKRGFSRINGLELSQRDSTSNPACKNGVEQEPEDVYDDSGEPNRIPWFAETRIRWEKWWWKKPHKLCLRCKHDCKQSWRVRVSKCPVFSPLEEKP